MGWSTFAQEEPGREADKDQEFDGGYWVLSHDLILLRLRGCRIARDAQGCAGARLGVKDQLLESGVGLM